MTNPQIATILKDGTYGQREMTDKEYAELLALNATEEPTEDAE